MASNTAEEIQISPMDQWNSELVANVHPPDWVNPEPAKSYNLVVIGAGTAGLVTAAGAAGLGAKVALVERHLMGGDCLNVGCVPSKAIIRSARVVADLQDAGRFGVSINGSPQIDFPAAMERVRRIRAGISGHDSAKRFSELGVDVFLGQASFLDSDTVEVAGKKLRFKKAVLASGARATPLPIEGLEEAGYLNNETVFNLTELPKRLLVIGAGPIGCELAQTFRLLGSNVSLLQDKEHILVKEDPDAAEIVEKTLKKQGVGLVCCAETTRVEKSGSEKIVHYKQKGKNFSKTVDEILVAVGRAPNIEGLELERLGVKYNKYGVEVDDRLQTSNPKIYAAGDICMRWKFTHAADAAARIVIQNSLFFGRKKLSALTMPWCTYTHPEIAHVGLNESMAKKEGIEVSTFTQPLSGVDRAITDGEKDGFVKIHVKKGSDQILGATIVATHAGDMISEVTLAMTAKVGLGKLANVIHPYPTQAEAIKRVADSYNRTRLTPAVKNIFSTWLKFIR